MLPKDHPHSVALERDELRSAIERVAQFADERSRAIRVRVAEGEVKIHSSVSETGESEESVPVEYDGPAGRDRFQRAVPARFSARRSSERGVVSCSRTQNSAGECGRHGEQAGHDYRYVVMPMRI